MTTITTRIVKIGNSQGIRIPKVLLEQVGFKRDVTLHVDKEQIVIRNVKIPRQGWAAQFQRMAELGDDTLLDEVDFANEWDEEEWEW